MHNHSLKAVREILINQLSKLYERHEAESISWWLLEDVLCKSRAVLLSQQQEFIDNQAYEKLMGYMPDLLNARPVQYVLGYAFFRDLKLYVNESTLIPRSETEELVETVLQRYSYIDHEVQGLDMGTGSGCIPIALTKENPLIRMDAMDKHADAVAVGIRNAEIYNPETNFIVDDLLNADLSKYKIAYDFIVSNPPYVLESDKIKMQKNVLDFEPASALYVPDNDALKFYNAIVDFSRKTLNPSGVLFLEIHEEKAEEISELLKTNGFKNVTIKKDMFSKDRIAIAEK